MALRVTGSRYLSLFGAAIALILAGQPAATGQTRRRARRPPRGGSSSTPAA